MLHEVIRARDQVSELKHRSSLLGAVDHYFPNNLPVFARAEVTELQVELEKPNDRIELAKVADENADVWVLMLSYLLSTQSDYDFAAHLHGVNGEGKRSDVFDKLQSVLSEVGDDKQAVHHAVRLLYSLTLHLPVPLVGLTEFHRTIRKVYDNRPPELYSSTDSQGRPLGVEDTMKKYRHLERMTKFLRSVVGRTLRPADWVPYSDLFLDFHNSDMAFSIFKTLIIEQNSLAAGEVPRQILVVGSQTPQQ